ncbi:MAG: FtsX-like permease family protein [Roseivirga sp.]|nr:FtsX-like permease family protein [Roseivirga sp.]
MDKPDFSQNPPKWANRFLEFYCADELLDEIQGDLLEAFFHRQTEFGRFRASLWFVWDVIRFFRPSSFSKRNWKLNANVMFKNHLLISYRSFLRQKVYASINLTGLVVGLSSCLLIILYIFNETGYDRFHPEVDQKYRVVMDMYSQGTLTNKSATVFAGVGPSLLTDYPEVESYVTISPFASGVFTTTGLSTPRVMLNQDRVIYASRNFFDYFGFELLYGNKEELLNQPFSAVIAESVAMQYFGRTDVVGEILKRQGQEEFSVMGVMKDMPSNSHMNYDIVLSLSSFDDLSEALADWSWSDFYSYVRLTEGTEAEVFNKKLESYLDRKKAAVFEQYGVRQNLWIQPVRDIHLYSDLTWEMQANGSASDVYFLGVVAALILIIAWMNFVNLSTARAVRRAREVGVRKVLGSSKRQLRYQFLTEAFLYNLVAFVLSLGLVLLFVPIIHQSAGIKLNSGLLLEPYLLMSLAVLLVAGTFISGLYPAFVLSHFGVLRAIKGGAVSMRSRLREVLVTFQFVLAITLIFGVLIVLKQLTFMKERPLGMNLEQSLVINGARVGESFDDLVNRSGVVINELAALPEVTSVAAANMIPGRENFNLTSYTSRFTTNPKSSYNLMVSASYFQNLEIELKAGRHFDPAIKTDGKTVVLNESASSLLGFSSPEEAIGEVINRGKRSERRVIGVVRDFHHRSLKEAINPIVFYFDDVGDESAYYLLKVRANDMDVTMAGIEVLWEDVFPDNPLDYFFLDEFFDQQYKSDEQFNSVFIGFAGLAVFVACLGLFGLVSYTSEQNKKQIGIRKILGASVVRVVMLLAKSYGKLILISLVIALPVGYYLMKEWLSGFAYRTNIGFDTFALGVLIISLIAFATVIVKSLQAAMGNPINALREE